MLSFYTTAIRLGYLTMDMVPAIFVKQVKEALGIEDEPEETPLMP